SGVCAGAAQALPLSLTDTGVDRPLLLQLGKTAASVSTVMSTKNSRALLFMLAIHLPATTPRRMEVI
ncbi:MAG: hypothetical protein ACI8RU_000160, partial [Zhongshania aliphaticivorans]